MNTPEKNTPPRILVVDDNAINVRVARIQLLAIGIESDGVVSGAEAIAIVQTRHYDAILMDIQMPEMDGSVASKAIRKLPIAQPIIIAWTADVPTYLRHHAIADGLDDWIAKPSPRAEIRSILFQHGIVGELEV